MTARAPRGEKYASCPQDFMRPFFPRALFTVSLDELSKRGTSQKANHKKRGRAALGTLYVFQETTKIILPLMYGALCTAFLKGVSVS